MKTNDNRLTTLEDKMVMAEENLKTIGSDIKTIKENHLAHIQVSMEGIKTNVDWMMKFFWIVSGASVSGLIASIFNLLK